MAAFWVIGPDDTVHSGEQQLSSKGLAIATTPQLASYLKGVGHTKLMQVRYPIALSTEDEKGTAGPLTAPASLDWWVAKANGTGTQRISHSAHDLCHRHRSPCPGHPAGPAPQPHPPSATVPPAPATSDPRTVE
ncbi:hypothetical protein [Kribbella sp.]|uniref:hypothetical protein n=1 Tax=Kribbella sp. TaxID=1871183 RepID=UPI002D3C31C8|nr:hypothetical protein [Kribbella sp.]HZX08918.1 hypothetical protein [Kribbella sp.]